MPTRLCGAGVSACPLPGAGPTPLLNLFEPTPTRLSGAGVSACPLPSAGPNPFFRRLSQPRRNRIVFDIPNNPAKLIRTPNPAVKRLIAPKRLTRQSQNSIRRPSGRPLQPTSNRWQRHTRCNQQMNMIRHDDPGVKVIEEPFVFSPQNNFRDSGCDSRICQPLNSQPIPIERPILRSESFARAQQNITRTSRHSSMQSPVDKNRNPFPMDMRQSSSVFEHQSGPGLLPQISVKTGALSQL